MWANEGRLTAASERPAHRASSEPSSRSWRAAAPPPPGATRIITTLAGHGTAVPTPFPEPPNVIPFPGEGGPATSATILPGPVALDPAGNLYVVNNFTRVVKVDKTTGLATTVA